MKGVRGYGCHANSPLREAGPAVPLTISLVDDAEVEPCCFSMTSELFRTDGLGFPNTPSSLSIL